MSHTQPAVIIADAHQRIESDKTYSSRNPWVGEGDTSDESIRSPGAQWATELLLDSKAKLADCMKLAQRKRCGHALLPACVSFFERLPVPRSCTRDRAAVQLSSGSGCWSASSMPQVGARTRGCVARVASQRPIVQLMGGPVGGAQFNSHGGVAPARPAARGVPH